MADVEGGDARLLSGRYRLVEPLGRGGMGTVWRGFDDLLGRDVAVKEVRYPPALSEEERRALRERTMREARAIARLSHAAVVTVYDVVLADERPWIVMELVHGRALADVLRDDGPLSPQRAAEIGLVLLGALEAAHAAGVIHRDVKPANVLLADDGRVVLGDFGIARVEGDPSLTSTGLVLGSPAYMAPERARGADPEPASDLWALGATLYAAVEGHPPFERGTAMATLGALVTEDPEPPRAAGPLAPALAGLLVKDPRTRLDAASARAMLTRVARPDGLVPAGATASPSGTPGPARRSWPLRGRGAVAGAVAGVVVLGALLLTWLVAGGSGGEGDRGRSAASSTPSATPSRTSTPTATSSATPTGTPTGTGSGGGLPAGFVRHEDPTGFSVAVPRGWKEVRDGTRVDFRDPRSRRFLRIDQTRSPNGDPVADWKRQERAFQERYPSYRRVSIKAVDYRSYDAADWEFTFRPGDGGRLHVLNRAAVTAPDRAYAVYWSTPAGDWAQDEDDLETVLGSFQPAD